MGATLDQAVGNIQCALGAADADPPGILLAQAASRHRPDPFAVPDFMVVSIRQLSKGLIFAVAGAIVIPHRRHRRIAQHHVPEICIRILIRRDQLNGLILSDGESFRKALVIRPQPLGKPLDEADHRMAGLIPIRVDVVKQIAVGLPSGNDRLFVVLVHRFKSRLRHPGVRVIRPGIAPVRLQPAGLRPAQNRGHQIRLDLLRVGNQLEAHTPPNIRRFNGTALGTGFRTRRGIGVSPQFYFQHPHQRMRPAEENM